ncbi:MAG: prepilin-type N-terminal cleavage/methylation domain-containing protein [Phycisphaerae bacterium]|nr:prepilin-type N-terminal cleavage/methylation domain-containing protein [Phycisphaerae bacterium]
MSTRNSIHRTARRQGFSLIELVIVVVIIGIIAAIAIPRLSRGAAGASDSAVSGDLAVLRTAVDLFSTEHGGSYPSTANFPNYMLNYTDVNAASFSTSKTGTCIYGPYLRSIPTLTVGPSGYKNTNTIIDSSAGTFGASAGAWWYNATTGQINANLDNTQSDASGKTYNSY